MDLIILRYYLLFFFYCSVNGVMFHLKPNTQKCLKDEMQVRQIITGEYEVSPAMDQEVDLVARDSKGAILYQKANLVRGKFSFSSEFFEMFELCFISRVPQHQRGIVHEVSIVIKKGIETKSYEGIDEAAKLKPLELDLKKLEDLSDAIVQDFANMRKREEEMRDTNESTNNRVLYFSIFSMCCLFGLATWQVLYLRKFFKAKKLIE